MELIKGEVYIVKHSSGFIKARFIWERKIVPKPNSLGRLLFSQRRTVTRYHFTNITTGREIVFKSLSKIRRMEHLDKWVDVLEENRTK